LPDLTVPAEVVGTPRTLVRFGVDARDGLGMGVSLAASRLPRGAVFAPADGVFEWTPSDDDLGEYSLTFTAANTLGAVTTKTVSLTIDSGLPRLAKLENGVASNAPAGCSPGSVATLRGHSLFAGAIPVSDRSGVSTELAGTRVSVNGDYAAVLYASSDRVDLLCPAADAGSTLTIAVETAAGRSNELIVAMQPSTPGLLTTEDSGTGQAVAVRSGSLEIATVPSDRLNGEPALAGDTLVFDATGFDCSSESVWGLSMHVGLDLMPVTSVRSAPGNAGICEVQVSVPASALGDAVPVTLQVIGKDGLKRVSNQGSISVASRF